MHVTDEELYKHPTFPRNRPVTKIEADQIKMNEVRAPRAGATNPGF